MTKADIFSETLAETVRSQRIDLSSPPQIRPALRRIGRALTSAVLATSLLIGSAAPSLADRRSDNFAKALGAALILGLALNAASKGQAAPAPAPQPQPQPQPQPRAEAPRVPAACAITLEGQAARAGVIYSGNCLRDEGFRHLPDCARPMRLYGQRDQAYSARCLREAGYRTQSRHNR